MGQIQCIHRIFYLMLFHIIYEEILYMTQLLFGKEFGEDLIPCRFLWVYHFFCQKKSIANPVDFFIFQGGEEKPF